MVRVPFSVENDWFSGQCEVLTYELDELVVTKVRALFDVYTALIKRPSLVMRQKMLNFVAEFAALFAGNRRILNIK